MNAVSQGAKYLENTGADSCCVVGPAGKGEVVPNFIRCTHAAAGLPYVTLLVFLYPFPTQGVIIYRYLPYTVVPC